MRVKQKTKKRVYNGSKYYPNLNANVSLNKIMDDRSFVNPYGIYKKWKVE